MRRELRPAESHGSPEVGKSRRLRRLFPGTSGRTLIVPVDDTLIFGPTAGLEIVHSTLEKIVADPPDGILAFPGVFKRSRLLLENVAGIVNLTASTARARHTRKVVVGSVLHAITLGVEAVAVHVNIGSKYEPEMLRALGQVARDCDAYGIPLLAIMYPRTEGVQGDDNYEELKRSSPKAYSDLVAHAARVGVDLGADIIKTKYTGDPESFERVVEACTPVPIVVAGGPVQQPEAVLQLASDVVRAGGAGISFGRNVFGRESPQAMISALKAIVHRDSSPADASLLLES